MSEPTKTYNMMRNAIVEWSKDKKNPKKAGKLLRTVAVFAITAAATSAAAAIVDAFRDDDDDEEWVEKWWDAFGKNFFNNINPLGIIPFVRDLLSLLQGYDVSRLDMQSLEKFVDAAQGWIKYFEGKGRQSLYQLTYKTVAALSDLTGLPIGNVMRAGSSLYNTFYNAGD